MRAACTLLVIRDGKAYDSKAIAGAAHGYLPGDANPLKLDEFSGGEATVVRRLRLLGFRVPPKRSPAWVRDEVILACDLVAQNGWQYLTAEDPRVVELSDLLQSRMNRPKSPAGGGQPVVLPVRARELVLDVEAERSVVVEVEVASLVQVDAGQWVGHEEPFAHLSQQWDGRLGNLGLLPRLRVALWQPATRVHSTQELAIRTYLPRVVEVGSGLAYATKAAPAEAAMFAAET